MIVNESSNARNISNTLLILPCNDGVCYGNYYKGGGGNNNWTTVRIAVPKKKDLFLAAVDCCPLVIPALQHNLDKGCLIFEDEMERVYLTHDHGPPTYAIKNFNQLKDLTSAIGVGLDRAINEYGFTRILTIMPVFFYRVALYKAITNKNLWHITSAFECCKNGYGRMLCSKANSLHKFPPGLIKGTFSSLATAPSNFRTTRWNLPSPTSANHSWYNKIPKEFRYFDFVPIPEIDPVLLSMLEGSKNAKINWNSFDEEDIHPSN